MLNLEWSRYRSWSISTRLKIIEEALRYIPSQLCFMQCATFWSTRSGWSWILGTSYQLVARTTIWDSFADWCKGPVEYLVLRYQLSTWLIPEVTSIPNLVAFTCYICYKTCGRWSAYRFLQNMPPWSSDKDDAWKWQQLHFLRSRLLVYLFQLVDDVVVDQSLCRYYRDAPYQSGSVHIRTIPVFELNFRFQRLYMLSAEVKEQ